MMALQKNNLIGWLCILRSNLDFTEAAPFQLPNVVRDGLVRHGWAEVTDVEWDGSQSLTITDAGHAISDLHAPEWGINPIPAA